MNASLGPSAPATLEERHFRLPPAALSRFARRLERDRDSGVAVDAAFDHAVDASRLAALVDYWLDTVAEETTSEELHAYPWFRLLDAHGELCFVHRRAADANALPLLVLHGSWGSLAELGGLIGPLSAPTTDSAGDAFHVVYPALPGFGVTRAQQPLTARELALACSALMARLGYERYLVHGSDIGARVAAELAALEPSRVVALHVTSLHAFPSEAGEDASALSSAEKSQLALLTLEHDELPHRLPRSPIEDLATALAQLADWDAPTTAFAPLLRSLALAWAFGDIETRHQLCLDERLRPAPPFEAPVVLETFPLDVPCLRRLVERKFRVVAHIEHERGGRLAALEASNALVQSLRRNLARLR